MGNIQGIYRFYKNLYRKFHMIFYKNSCQAMFVQNGSEIARNRSGMVPKTSRTLLGHFWAKTFCSNKCQTNMKCRQAGKPFSAINFRRRHVPPSFSACFDRGPFNHISYIYIYIYIFVFVFLMSFFTPKNLLIMPSTSRT